MSIFSDSRFCEGNAETIRLGHIRKIINHDFSGELSGVIGINEILSSNGDMLPEEDRMEMTKMVQTGLIGVQKNLTVLQVLASMSFFEPVIQPLSISTIARKQVEYLQQMLRDSGKTVTVGNCEGILQAPEFWLNTAIEALLVNAISFGGPRIAIETVSQQDDWIEILVRDTGSPIDPDFLPALFTPLEDSRLRDRHNTGLGTTLVRLIAEGLGGEAGYRRSGGDNCFFLKLPTGAEE